MDLLSQGWRVGWDGMGSVGPYTGSMKTWVLVLALPPMSSVIWRSHVLTCPTYPYRSWHSKERLSIRALGNAKISAINTQGISIALRKDICFFKWHNTAGQEGPLLSWPFFMNRHAGKGKLCNNSSKWVSAFITNPSSSHTSCSPWQLVRAEEGPKLSPWLTLDLEVTPSTPGCWGNWVVIVWPHGHKREK